MPPSRADVEARFVALLSGAESRDAVDRWAARHVRSDVVVGDDAVRWALDVLHGIDLRHGPAGPDLHDDTQVAEWLREFRERCASGHAEDTREEPGAEPEVTWSATSPRSGRLGRPTRSGLRDVAERWAELRERGEGYLELGRGDGSPLLTVGFLGDLAVLHLLSADCERSSLLMGDGTEAWSTAVEVLIIDELAVFSGAVAQHVDRAWALAQDFARYGDPARLGEWYDL